MKQRVEYLDIVDEKDRTIGKDTRENIHKKNLIHRGVHVFVLNNKGEILVQKRARDKDYLPGFYDASVGGQVLSGESYEQAAEREIKEELGLNFTNLKKVSDYHSYSERQKENRRLFIVKAEGPFKIDKTEIESVKFWLPDQIQTEIGKFTPGFKISFGELIKKGKITV